MHDQVGDAQLAEPAHRVPVGLHGVEHPADEGAGEQEPVQRGRVASGRGAGGVQAVQLACDVGQRLLVGQGVEAARWARGDPRVRLPGGQPHAARPGRGDGERHPGARQAPRVHGHVAEVVVGARVRGDPVGEQQVQRLDELGEAVGALSRGALGGVHHPVVQAARPGPQAADEPAPAMSSRDISSFASVTGWR